MCLQHGVGIANGTNDRYGDQFPLCIVEHISFENICKQMLFQKAIYRWRKSRITCQFLRRNGLGEGC